ncbi:MAG: hypothetical protein QOH51_2970 [Acidobacteriota bacterium]|jgi:hypothetical protein|nr:hypothetical protein [Acidobacteriota bacterium]
MASAYLSRGMAGAYFMSGNLDFIGGLFIVLIVLCSIGGFVFVTIFICAKVFGTSTDELTAINLNREEERKH